MIMLKFEITVLFCLYKKSIVKPKLSQAIGIIYKLKSILPQKALRKSSAAFRWINCLK